MHAALPISRSHSPELADSLEIGDWRAAS